MLGIDLRLILQSTLEQLERDRKKDAIFKKFGDKLLRFSTIGSFEARQIRERLDSIVQS